MKIFKKMTVFLLTLCIAGSLSVNVKAAEKKEYTYTVRFYSGARGTFGGKQIKVFPGLREGQRVTFNMSDVTLENGSKYYIKGIRESGKDNNTVSSQSSFVVTGDQDYVVAYGIKGNSVGYTVRYVDEDGNQLLPPETYYGNVGDRPVIAYQYIENYLPQAYNLTGTLKQNEAENVFTFTYTPINAGEAPEAPAAPAAPAAAPAAPAAGAAGGDAAAGDAAAAGAPDAGVAPAPDAAVPAALQDIQDGDVPLADVGEDQLTNIADEETPLSRGDFARRLLDLPVGAKAGILSLLVLLGIGGWYLYTKKKRKTQNAE